VIGLAASKLDVAEELTIPQINTSWKRRNSLEKLVGKLTGTVLRPSSLWVYFGFGLMAF